MPTRSKWQSLPTEAINPVSLAIDKAPVRDIIDMVVNEDRKVIAAVQKEKERIAHGIEIVVQALRKGGRIIFVGAGTSGRLGILESAEMPPTFGTCSWQRPLLGKDAAHHFDFLSLFDDDRLRKPLQSFVLAVA